MRASTISLSDRSTSEAIIAQKLEVAIKVNSNYELSPELIESLDAQKEVLIRHLQQKSNVEMTCNVNTNYCIIRNNSPKKFFISYSKDDETELNRFITHLSDLRRTGLVDIFFDKMTRYGENCDETIKRNIDECDFMICLVSASYMNTDYIRDIEIPRAIKQKKKIITIILKPYYWKGVNICADFISLKGDCITIDEKKDIQRTPIEQDKMWTMVIKEFYAKIFNM